MKKRETRNQEPAMPMVDGFLQLQIARQYVSLAKLHQLALDEWARGREEVVNGILATSRAIRADILCRRMGWPTEVAVQLARKEPWRTMPSDRVICADASPAAAGQCSYSEPLQLGRVYVVRDVFATDFALGVRLTGILGGLADDGTEQGWFEYRFFVLDDVKEAFAAVRASVRGQ